ncbi:MAG: transporter [Frondihabitans sp.]|nr:transporter [Frondihabitans sp.]
MPTSAARTHHQVTFAVLAVGVGAFSLLQSLVTPVLPTIQAALHTTQSDVTWVLTSYLLSAAIFTPILGRLGDMRGKKRIFVIALIALAIGSLLAALATSLPIMIVARVIQGLGGGVLPLAFGIIRDEFPAEKVGGAVGLIASLTAIGGGLGVVLAGPIVALLDYHWLFWIPLIMIGAAAIAAIALVPESEIPTPGRINWLAAALMAMAFVALLVAISEGSDWGWGSVRVISLIVVAVIVGAIWVLVELRSDNPLVDMRLMAVRSVWAINIVALLFGAALFSLFAFLPEFLQTPTSTGYGFGRTITESGLMILPQSVAMFLMGLVAGRVARRVGSKSTLVFGAILSVVALLLLAFVHAHTWEIYLATAITGIGFGLVFAASSSIIVNAVPREQTGVASGMNANIRSIGGSIGAAMIGSVVTAHLAPTGLPLESGYTTGFAVLAGVLVVSAIAGLLIPSVKRTLVRGHRAEPEVALEHAELALVAGGTVVGDESE